VIDSQDYGLIEPKTEDVLSQNGSDEQTLIDRDPVLFAIHAQESESSFLIETYSNNNNAGQESLANHRSAEALLKNSFRQYCGRFLNFLIRLRKADFLFPFHYFW